MQLYDLGLFCRSGNATPQHHLQHAQLSMHRDWCSPSSEITGVRVRSKLGNVTFGFQLPESSILRRSLALFSQDAPVFDQCMSGDMSGAAVGIFLPEANSMRKPLPLVDTSSS